MSGIAYCPHDNKRQPVLLSHPGDRAALQIDGVSAGLGMQPGLGCRLHYNRLACKQGVPGCPAESSCQHPIGQQSLTI